MRIVARVAGAGTNGLSRIPFLDIDSIDGDLCTNGHLDESKCRRALAKSEGSVQIASTDTLPVFAFAIELLKQVHDACQRMIDDPTNKNVRGTADIKDDIHAERKLNKGRVVFVREDITYRHDSEVLSFRIDVQNPLNVPGCAISIAEDYALIVARIANHIADELTATKGNRWKFEFSGGAGCPDIFDEARKIDRTLAMRTKRIACPNRIGDFCSPIHPECPCYKCGRCVEYKEK